MSQNIAKVWEKKVVCPECGYYALGSLDMEVHQAAAHQLTPPKPIKNQQ